MPQQRCLLPHVAYSRELSFEQAGVEKWQRRIAEGRAVEYWEPLVREAAAEHAPATAPEPDIAPPQACAFRTRTVGNPRSRTPLAPDSLLSERTGTEPPLLFWLLFAVFCLFFGPRGVPLSSQPPPLPVEQHDPRSAPHFHP